MVITIDGPAGSGKSAAALLLARTLGFAHLDTGAMYRAVALAALQHHAVNDAAAMAALARHMTLEFDRTVAPARVLLDSRDVTDEIRTPEVTRITRNAADNLQVRSELVRRQRLFAQQLGDIVSEGRDQGSVAFPHADFKFFLDADARVRAQRRQRQLTASGVAADAESIYQDILRRDHEDRTRPVGPLIQTPDAITIDATTLTLEQVAERMAEMVRDKMPSPHNREQTV